MFTNLIPFVVFLRENTDACSDSLDWCDRQGDITMSEFATRMLADDTFEPEWAFYAIVLLRKVVKDDFITACWQKISNRPDLIQQVNAVNPINREYKI